MTRRGNRGKVQPRLFHRSHRAWKSRNGRGIPTFPQPRRRRAPFTIEDQPAKIAGPVSFLRRALKLQKKHTHTVNLTVSSYSSYAQFLEKFAEKVLRAGGSWERVKDLVRRFVQRVKPEAKVDLTTGEISLSFKGAESNPALFAPEVCVQRQLFLH